MWTHGHSDCVCPLTLQKKKTHLLAYDVQNLKMQFIKGHRGNVTLVYHPISHDVIYFGLSNWSRNKYIQKHNWNILQDGSRRTLITACSKCQRFLSLNYAWSSDVYMERNTCMWSLSLDSRGNMEQMAMMWQIHKLIQKENLKLLLITTIWIREHVMDHADAWQNTQCPAP
jgi:hypothetical protein